MASSNDERVLYNTKIIQFFGRSTPIILQNDNGPCPLVEICNILLLRNQLNLGYDARVVSQEKLLSLVAERLIDSNSNNNNKDAGYVENQQQIIADAIDLLPRLTTGINVNIKFRRIDDFEFTPECAIFDLLDIPLYHGWVVDPQDHETAAAIGSKSYNTLMVDLVSLKTLKMEKEGKDKSDDDCIDFATATFGVPSPCLSRAKSFEESPRSSSDQQATKNGDTEEVAELLTALKLSVKDFLSNKEATSSVGVVMSSNENLNLLYEGEMVLAEQADRGTNDACDGSGKEEISLRQGELIDNFLNSTPNQLTLYGLFCLQEGLKERELCVFFRNNHFSTMFKRKNHLYLLGSDEWYINAPDHVWEKLNDVNGETNIMTTSEFKNPYQEDSNDMTWEQQNAPMKPLPTVCLHCWKVVATVRMMRSHRAIHTSHDWKLLCVICGNVFTEEEFDIHMQNIAMGFGEHSYIAALHGVRSPDPPFEYPHISLTRLIEPPAEPPAE